MSPELRKLPGGTRKVGSVLQKTDKAEDQPWVGSKQPPTRAIGPGQGHKTPSLRPPRPPSAAAHVRECQDGGVERAAEGCSWGLGGKGGKWSVLLSPQLLPQSKELVDGFSSRDGESGF